MLKETLEQFLRQEMAKVKKISLQKKRHYSTSLSKRILL